MPVGQSSADQRRRWCAGSRRVRGEVPVRRACASRASTTRAPSTRSSGTTTGGVRLRPDGPGAALRLRHDGAAARRATAPRSAEFTLAARARRAAFVLEAVPPEAWQPSAAPDYGRATAFKDTVNFWRAWIGALDATRGRWREMVNRSALTLKLLTSQPHGSIVAAPTFGLPEELGGERNWDYRYTWIRDASFTLYALMRLGYTEEAGGFMRWIETAAMELNPRRLAADHVRHRRPPRAHRGDRCRTSRATGARARCGSATAPTTSFSSTSTAS